MPNPAPLQSIEEARVTQRSASTATAYGYMYQYMYPNFFPYWRDLPSILPELNSLNK
jgi:hypothetical protein